MIMYVENDSDGNDVFKHIATLIDVETDTVDDSIDVIGEYPIMENGHVLTTPLEDCIEICREGEQITMSDFTDILSNISHAKEGSSPIMGLARILKDYKLLMSIHPDLLKVAPQITKSQSIRKVVVKLANVLLKFKSA